MFKLIALFATLAALLHVLFFCFETLWWMRPATMKRFRLTPEEAQATRSLAFNQGFYNLFLAIGAGLGILDLALGYQHSALILIGWNCLSMLGAAVVLALSSPKMIRGALIQGLAPLVVLICLAIVHLR